MGDSTRLKSLARLDMLVQVKNGSKQLPAVPTNIIVLSFWHRRHAFSFPVHLFERGLRAVGCRGSRIIALTYEGLPRLASVPCDLLQDIPRNEVPSIQS